MTPIIREFDFKTSRRHLVVLFCFKTLDIQALFKKRKRKIWEDNKLNLKIIFYNFFANSSSTEPPKVICSEDDAYMTCKENQSDDDEGENEKQESCDMTKEA